MTSFKIKMPRFEPCATFAALFLSISIPTHNLLGHALLGSREVARSVSASLSQMALQSSAIKLTNRKDDKWANGDQADDISDQADDKFKNGSKTQEFENGDEYEGQWNSEDEFHGEGTYTWASGRKYVGAWVKGKKQGYGRQTYGDGSDFYEGAWVNNEYHGQGTLRLDGDEFEGLWKDGAWCDGVGKSTYEGHKYEGRFKDGVPHGSGKWTYANLYRKVYEGQLEEWRPHGKGTMKYADGSVYVGYWKKGKEDGHGKMTYSDRSVYDGKWENGNSHGCGVMTYLGGVTEIQCWKDGKLQFSSEEEQRGHVDSHNRSEKGDSLMPEQDITSEGQNRIRTGLEENKLRAIEKKGQWFNKVDAPLSKEKDDKSDLEEEKDGSASPPEQDVDQVEDHSSRSSGQDDSSDHEPSNPGFEEDQGSDRLELQDTQENQSDGPKNRIPTEENSWFSTLMRGKGCLVGCACVIIVCVIVWIVYSK